MPSFSINSPQGRRYQANNSDFIKRSGDWQYGGGQPTQYTGSKDRYGNPVRQGNTRTTLYPRGTYGYDINENTPMGNPILRGSGNYQWAETNPDYPGGYTMGELRQNYPGTWGNFRRQDGVKPRTNKGWGAPSISNLPNAQQFQPNTYNNYVNYVPNALGNTSNVAPAGQGTQGQTEQPWGGSQWRVPPREMYEGLPWYQYLMSRSVSPGGVYQGTKSTDALTPYQMPGQIPRISTQDYYKLSPTERQGLQGLYQTFGGNWQDLMWRMQNMAPQWDQRRTAGWY